MDNFQGDLTDILLAGSGRHVAPLSSSSSATPAPGCWKPSDFPMNNFPSSSSSSNGHHNSFGDPFLNMADPLLHELNMVAAASGSYFPNASPKDNFVISRVPKEGEIPRIKVPQGIRYESSPCNSPLFSGASSVGGIGNYGASPRAVVSGNVINVVDTHTNSPRQQLQISSPRNLGLKRRKSQSKKVVCIPAPAAANSRSTGEIVPSDLWAWRKYGQKPIKGSPYPRGYYRCSSSKGCSARKQVERSRTDPSMLVITYTSEHNHPWPTQRNALAGSTRSVHPTKPNTSNSSRSSLNPSNTGNLSTLMVKEEVDDKKEHDEFDDGLSGGIGDFGNQTEDFFADLDELGSDSLSLLLDRGAFGLGDEDDQKSKQGLESFENFLDWSENSNNNYVWFGETARSL